MPRKNKKKAKKKSSVRNSNKTTQDTEFDVFQDQIEQQQEVENKKYHEKQLESQKKQKGLGEMGKTENESNKSTNGPSCISLDREKSDQTELAAQGKLDMRTAKIRGQEKEKDGEEKEVKKRIVELNKQFVLARARCLEQENLTRQAIQRAQEAERDRVSAVRGAEAARRDTEAAVAEAEAARLDTVVAVAEAETARQATETARTHAIEIERSLTNAIVESSQARTNARQAVRQANAEAAQFAIQAATARQAAIRAETDLAAATAAELVHRSSLSRMPPEEREKIRIEEQEIERVRALESSQAFVLWQSSQVSQGETKVAATTATTATTAPTATTATTATTPKREKRELKNAILVSAGLSPMPSPSATAIQSIARDSASTCIICMENPTTRLFTPCGHHCICGPCAVKYHDSCGRRSGCPMCRVRYTGIIKMFTQ